MSKELRHSKNKGGRPSVFDTNTLQKLEDAFMFCYSDKEACLYANISPSALYNYQSAHPEFKERKELLRLTPNLRAKKVLVEGVSDINQARWWAEHKMSDEFGAKTKVDIGGAVGLFPVPDEMIEKLRKETEEKIRNMYLSIPLKKKDENH